MGVKVIAEVFVLEIAVSLSNQVGSVFPFLVWSLACGLGFQTLPGCMGFPSWSFPPASITYILPHLYFGCFFSPTAHSAWLFWGFFGFLTRSKVTTIGNALLRCRTKSHSNSFISHNTASLWNSLPGACFPQSYNLDCFKRDINSYL